MATDEVGARGLRAIVYEALPPHASPTDTLCQPLHRHVLENAQGDIVELTRQKVTEQLQGRSHVVVVLRDGDLNPATDGDLLGLLEQTDGGVLVFGVTYDLDESASGEGDRPPGAAPAVSGESCPECGATDAFEIDRGDIAEAVGRRTVLIECRECGAVWDSYAGT